MDMAEIVLANRAHPLTAALVIAFGTCSAKNRGPCDDCDGGDDSRLVAAELAGRGPAREAACLHLVSARGRMVVWHAP
jgi:hypothetical protein